MKIVSLTALIIVIGALALSACSGGSDNLEGTMWRMTAFRNADGEIVETLLDVKSTAEFKDGRVSGKAACNTYGGPYELDGNKISFGLMETTLMACPEPIMAQETGYLAALASADTFEVGEETLTFFDADGNTVLEFAVLEPASLVGTNWLLISYNNGRGGMQSLIAGSEVTVNFDEDGGMSGSAGCNDYFGRYEATEDSIGIEELENTEMFCADPEGVMEQESQYLLSLQNAAVYTIRDDRLEIRDENGSGVAYYIVMP